MNRLAECASNNREPVIQRLRRQKEELQSRINDISAVLDKLEANPEVSEILEGLNKLGSI